MGCAHQREQGQPVLSIEMSQDNTMRVGAERDGHDAEHEEPDEGARQLGATIIRHGDSREQRGRNRSKSRREPS